MARKPRSQWSAAYRRRVERAERAGKTRQQARGHRPREHVTRAQNKTRAVKRPTPRQRKLTKRQLKNIHNFARSQSKRMDITTRELERELKEFVREEGYEDLDLIMKRQRALRDQYKNEVRRKRYATRGEGLLEDISIELGVPNEGWLYYH